MMLSMYIFQLCNQLTDIHKINNEIYDIVGYLNFQDKNDTNFWRGCNTSVT
jgi:hypothetical protein